MSATVLRVHRGKGGVRTSLSSGFLVPRVTSSSTDRVAIILVAAQATLLAGDHVELLVELGEGVHLDLRDIAATVAYNARGASASWRTELTLSPGASLTWWGEPLVVSEGADVRRELFAELSDGARLLMRDVVARGRSGEKGGRLRCHTNLTWAGRPAFVEELTLDDEHAALPGYLQGARVLESVTALGWLPCLNFTENGKTRG